MSEPTDDGTSTSIPARPVRIGRPPIGNELAEDNKVLQVVVDPERRRAYRTAAERAGARSLSEWIRDTCDKEIGIVKEPRRRKRAKSLPYPCDDCHGTGVAGATLTAILGVFTYPLSREACLPCSGTGRQTKPSKQFSGEK